MGLDSVLGQRYFYRGKTINAVGETAAEKPVFRESIRNRRCLIPADGFYEWKQIGPKKKQAYNIGMKDDGLFAFAGLWDRWKSLTESQLNLAPS